MRIQVVGRGRVGTAVTAALSAAGWDVLPIGGRGATGSVDGVPADVVLLAVPDAEISRAAAHIAPGPSVGHFSGATTLDPLGDRDTFSLHPLLTVTGESTDFAGVYAAVAATTEPARNAVTTLADALGLITFEVRDEDRAAYHAAASVASNFLLTLEHFAETLAATAGVPREALVPLVRAAVDNWARQGSAGALTGPIARGDDETVAKQRAAVALRTPDQLDLFDALAAATRDLAREA